MTCQKFYSLKERCLIKLNSKDLIKYIYKKINIDVNQKINILFILFKSLIVQCIKLNKLTNKLIFFIIINLFI